MESQPAMTPSEPPLLECPICGSDDVTTIMHPHKYTYGTPMEPGNPPSNYP